MLKLGIFLIILGFIAKLFSSVFHITNSVLKAMFWTLINTVAAILGGALILVGIIVIILSFFGF